MSDAAFDELIPANERRATRRRHGVNDHGIVSARVRPRYDVSVVDVSAGGALVESHCRLLPGVSVELQLNTLQRCAAVRGRVLRCTVWRLRSTSVCYRGAIVFDAYLPWFADPEPAGSAMSTADRRPGGPGRVVTAPPMM